MSLELNVSSESSFKKCVLSQPEKVTEQAADGNAAEGGDPTTAYFR